MRLKSKGCTPACLKGIRVSKWLLPYYAPLFAVQCYYGVAFVVSRPSRYSNLYKGGEMSETLVCPFCTRCEDFQVNQVSSGSMLACRGCGRASTIAAWRHARRLGLQKHTKECSKVYQAPDGDSTYMLIAVPALVLFVFMILVSLNSVLEQPSSTKFKGSEPSVSESRRVEIRNQMIKDGADPVGSEVTTQEIFKAEREFRQRRDSR